MSPLSGRRPGRDTVGSEAQEDLAEALAQARAELGAVHASTSWRVTAPLRMLSGWLRRSAIPESVPSGSVSGPHSRWVPDPTTIAAGPRVPLEGPGRPMDPASLELHWILPDAATASGGGHMTIFRHVRFLERQGHRQTLWLRPPWFHDTPVEAMETIRTHYQALGDAVRVQFLPDDVREISGDAVIATDFWTVYPVLAMNRFRERCYLVQDYEADFHPRGAIYHLARNSYGFGLRTLCAGSWLFRRMTEEFGAWARQWDLAYDSSFYFRRGETDPARGIAVPDEPSIAFYHRPSTPRRAVELGLTALRMLHSRSVRFHVHFFGEPLASSPPYAHTDHGTLDASRLGDLYRACDLGMVFSATNYSLIPLEMMACGLPVLELDSECTRAVFPPGALFLAKPDPEIIAEVLGEALVSEERRREVVRKAFAFTADLDWERSSRALEQAIREALQEHASTRKSG